MPVVATLGANWVEYSLKCACVFAASVGVNRDELKDATGDVHLSSSTVGDSWDELDNVPWDVHVAAVDNQDELEDVHVAAGDNWDDLKEVPRDVHVSVSSVGVNVGRS